MSEDHRIRIHKVQLPAAEGIAAFSVESPPAFIVLAAVQGIFGKRPDAVIAGPNEGLNLGPLVLHSGTFGAAVTAASNGIPAIALSTEKRPKFGYDTAARFCARHLGDMLAAMGPAAALNVNVPDLPKERVACVRQTRLAPRSLVSILLMDDEAPMQDGELRRMRIELDHDHDRSRHRASRAGMLRPDDTDSGAIVDNCISVTVMHGGLLHVDGRNLFAAWQP